MRIEREDGTAVGPTWAVLTAEEAHDLATALIDYFDALAEGEVQSGWHHHLGTGDQVYDRDRRRAHPERQVTRSPTGVRSPPFRLRPIRPRRTSQTLVR